MDFGALSYGLASLAFIALTGLLYGRWPGSSPGKRLVVASAGTAAWGLVLAASSAWSVPRFALYVVEAGHFGLWLAALSGIGAAVVPRALRIVGSVAWAAMVLSGVAIQFTHPPLLGSAMARGGIACSLVAIVALEQIYRNSEPQIRPALKWLVAGIGLPMAFDLFMYSQAELLRGIGTDVWDARGIAYAIAVPVIAIAIKRNPQWTLDIFVSRHVVFYSATFLVVGAGLLAMAVGGYYVRAIGGSWGLAAQILFWTIGTFLLLWVLASDAMRRRLRVFISKHFYRNKYDYRIEWLRFIRTLSSTDEGDVRRTAVRAVTQIFGSPGGALLRLDESGRRFQPVAAWPMDTASMPGLSDVGLDEPLARFLAESQWIIDLDEYRLSPGKYGAVELPRWIRADPTLRIVSPMIELDKLVGIFVLYAPPPPFELTYEDRDLLKTVSQHVATQIAQHESDRKLAESRQFEAYNKLTAFMMHDLKNSVAQLRLIVTNADRHRRNPDFVDDVIDTIDNTVRRMSGLIDQLRGTGVAETRTIALGELLAATVQRCSDRVPTVAAEVPDAQVWVRADPDRLGAVIEHVIRNAQDATPEHGSIRCVLAVAGDNAMLAIEDTGAGMPQDFVRERLFRPFDSTKGAKGMGIGAYQVREYVRMIGGDVEVQSSPGTGTRFCITLPRSPGPDHRPVRLPQAGEQIRE